MALAATTADAISQVSSDRPRVGAVRRLVALYRPPDAVFDRLTRLAAGLLEAPVALITLIDADRQFFVSSFGLPDAIRAARQTTLQYSLCVHAVASSRPFIVGDARREPSLQDNLAVTELGVAAYAGVPLLSADGFAVGALCVLDFVPREWTDDRLALLAELAEVVTDELRLAGLRRQGPAGSRRRGGEPSRRKLCEP